MITFTICDIYIIMLIFQHQYLTTLCLEVHVTTRHNLLPDPRHDPIAAVFYAIHNDVPLDWTKSKPLECGTLNSINHCRIAQ